MICVHLILIRACELLDKRDSTATLSRSMHRFMGLLTEKKNRIAMGPFFTVSVRPRLYGIAKATLRGFGRPVLLRIHPSDLVPLNSLEELSALK